MSYVDLRRKRKKAKSTFSREKFKLINIKLIKSKTIKKPKEKLKKKRFTRFKKLTQVSFRR